MARVFVGLGSNLGDRFEYLQRALDELGRLRSTRVTKISPVYETAPVGDPDQSDFLNAVAELSTELEPGDLFGELKIVEKKVGRTPSRRWGPREIDIDILLYGDRIISTGGLTIPHPRMTERKFVMVPLAETDPRAVHPILHETVEAIAGRCTTSERIEKFPDTLRIP